MPVLVRLHGADVIHSFWVPKLTGKTDTIPGQTNLSWMQATQPGRYSGQCTEYCGYQHAHMAVRSGGANRRRNSTRWRRAPAAARGARRPIRRATRGMELVEYRCGLCHQVRGTAPAPSARPDLTHLMSRRTLAAGTLPNNPGNSGRLDPEPQELKPGNLMPNQYLIGTNNSSDVARLPGDAAMKPAD